METLALDSIVPEPWRNGGGITRTVAREGDKWRVSIAEVQRNGPYSRFEGLSRISFVLRGEGIILRDTKSAIKLSRLQATGYDGGTSWEAILVGGPVTALNVMSQRERYRVQVASVASSIVVNAGRSAIVFAWSSECQVQIQAEERVLKSGNAAIFRELNDELRITNNRESASTDDESDLIVVVTIEPVQK
jgi:uncharacterized protein